VLKQGDAEANWDVRESSRSSRNICFVLVASVRNSNGPEHVTLRPTSRRWLRGTAPSP